MQQPAELLRSIPRGYAGKVRLSGPFPVLSDLWSQILGNLHFQQVSFWFWLIKSKKAYYCLGISGCDHPVMV